MLRSGEFSVTPTLLFIFGNRELLETGILTNELVSRYPDAVFAGCSTAGEIARESVKDNSIVVTAIEFERTTIQTSKISLDEIHFSSSEAGKKLVSQLPVDGLRHVFVLSDGLKVNGTDLVKGMQEALAEDVTLTGGLAGDGPHFEKTVIVEPDGKVVTESIMAVGFLWRVTVDQLWIPWRMGQFRT